MGYFDDIASYMAEQKVLVYEVDADVVVKIMRLCSRHKRELGVSPRAKIRSYHFGILNPMCHTKQSYTAVVIDFPNKKEAMLFKLRYPNPNELIDALPT
jgi:hypothetical protein